MTGNSSNDANSIAGQSAAHFIARDDSLASLLLNHGIKVRDFILLSFLSDQGPMSIMRLSRVVGIAPDATLNSLQRLSAVNLVLREPASMREKYEAMACLTTRGKEIAGRICAQMNGEDTLPADKS
jgi:DNA-binding MarR family transcriptional regulator